MCARQGFDLVLLSSEQRTGRSGHWHVVLTKFFIEVCHKLLPDPY